MLGLLALLLLFHRPIIFRTGLAVANHYSSKANLKIVGDLGGSIFTSLIARHVHIVPTGPTIVEAIDIDYVRADYSVWDLLRRGQTEFLKNVELRVTHVVLDPAKASLEPKIPPPDERIKLFPIFPERLRLFDVNLAVRSPKQNFLLEHLDLELDPTRTGELRMSLLQIPDAGPWKNISAHTSYTNKKLVISGLVLDQENQFRLLVFDASHIAARSIEIVLDASLAGGTIAGSVALREAAPSIETKVRLVAENISLDTLRGYIGQSSPFLSGEAEHLALQFSGVVNAPRTWDGRLDARMHKLREGSFLFDEAIIGVTAHNGVATVESAEATRGANTLRLKGTAELPEQIRSFGQSPATFEVEGALPDLQSLTAELSQPVTGAATIKGKVEIKDAILRADLRLAGGPVAFDQTSAAQFTGTLVASKRLPATATPTNYYADLRSEIHLDLTDVHSRDYLVDSAHADIRVENNVVTLERVAAVRNKNQFNASGEYRLPDDFSRLLSQPGRFNVSLGAIDLADYWIGDAKNRITGPLKVSGGITTRDGKAEGQLSIYGSNLKYGNIPIPELSAQASIANNVVYLNDFTAKLNAQDYVGGSGVVSLDRPYHYSGKVFANVADLSRMKPLLVALGNNNEIAGSLFVDWQGSGDAAERKNSGKLKLTLEKGRYANLRALQANFDATYSPEVFDIPSIFIGSDKMTFQAIAHAKDSTLEITKIQIDQGQAKYAAGYISFPFVWKNVGTDRPLFPSDGKVRVTFQSENLDLKKLFDDVGAKPLATGLINLKIDADGTLASLGGRLALQMRELHSAEYPKLEPASFDLVTELRNNQLTFNGKLQQTKIQPVQITGNLPFDLSKIVAERKFDDQAPLSMKVQLPRSSVNFLRQFIPGITQLDGDLALDVNITGTVVQPRLSGTGDITINRARFANATLPSLSGFRSRLAFDHDVLNFERFAGDLAGGPFTVSGRITFPKLTEPNLDFQVKAQSVLIARNDSLTARADGEIKVVGLWKNATVSGSIALTNSQFLKNIDLIPIGLPGRPAPQPPTDRPDFSVTDPPIRDWKFDVAIKTKDPFLIRGNLAHGGAISDLHLGGTGLHPELQGTVRLENVEATLPFSRLEIAQGFLYFDPSDSFNPKIDLHGTSLIRDYTVHVYVYGTTLSPEALFTSEPPLPQEDIISLLATGTTREELIGNNSVLAGRAAMLLVQQLYRKVFKKGEPTRSNSVFNKLQVDVGNVDPRTGQQSVTARLKLNDQFVLVGDLGVGGDFRGMVKYLIRFK